MYMSNSWESISFIIEVRTEFPLSRSEDTGDSEYVKIVKTLQPCLSCIYSEFHYHKPS